MLADDMRARRVAESLGIKVVGTLGLVVMAWEKQLIGDSPRVVARLPEEGIWLADPVYQRAVEKMAPR